MRKPKQIAMHCRCGRQPILALGLCATCYTLRRQDAEYFGGHREAVLARDGHRCRIPGCTTRKRGKRSVAVHHRVPGNNDPNLMMTLKVGPDTLEPIDKQPCRTDSSYRVPQSFSGYSFDTFRQRRLESKRLAEQERLRKEEEDRSLREWMVGEARKTLADPKASEKRRAEAEGIITAYDVAQDVEETS